MRWTVMAVLAAGMAHAQEGPVIYVTPNPIGVNDFLRLGAEGTRRAAEAAGLEAKVYESSDPTTSRQNLEAAAAEGASVVVAISFQFDDLLPEVAAAHPDTAFLQVDSCAPEPPENLHCAVFREHEAAFLAGAVAALTSENGQVGSIGAVDIPFLHRYTDGFAEGAAHVAPEVGVSPTLWIGGDNPFSDPARGQQRATVMFSTGADRVLAAGAGSNGGIFQAAGDFPGAAAFGVDVNQCPQAPGAVMDNVEKRTDVAVERGVADILAGDRAQVEALGLAEGGVTLTGLEPGVEESGCLIADYPDVIERVSALRDEIASGALSVDDPMAAGG